MSQSRTMSERIADPAPKKVLSIDGGGIRGVIALEVLLEIETMLRRKTGNPNYLLSDYFDAIGGTSTGAIIATGLSLGFEVSQLLDFYVDNGAAMFRRSHWLSRLRYKFDGTPLTTLLKQEFGARTLGTRDLRTLLMVMLRNATTDSPWPVSNNPYALYNSRDHSGCNLNLPLWQLVRASTAAPTYFPPERAVVGDRSFLFVDGGVTMYNNPAFRLFLMLTVDRFWACAPPQLARGWSTGRDRMLLVSVGTGTNPGANDRLEPREMNLLFNANTIPSALMFSALIEQDELCRIFGDCVVGDRLDREIGTLKQCQGPTEAKLFRYLRYNADLTAGGLLALGCNNVEPTLVQKLDSVSAIGELRRIGKAVSQTKLKEADFALETFAP